MRVPAQSFALLLILCVTAGADELPAHIASLLKETERQATIKRRDLNDKPKLDLLVGSPSFMHVGAIGAFNSFRVIQVIDAQNMLVDVSWEYPSEYQVEGTNFRTIQTTPTTAEAVWMSGFPTSGLVDGNSYAPEGTFVLHVVGTKTYDAALRQRTTFELRLVPFKQYIPAFEEARKNRRINAEAVSLTDAEVARAKAEDDRQAKHKAEVAAYYARNKRTWQDKTGTFKTEAAFHSLKSGSVVLVKLDGKTIEVPLTKLSESDRRFAVQRGRERGQIAPKTPPSPPRD